MSEAVNDDTLPQSSLLFSDLAPFLDLAVDQSSNLKIGDLAFASAEDRWSTCYFPTSAVTAAGSTNAGRGIAAGLKQNLFQTDINAAGQGSGTVTLSISETNLKGGLRQPANQVYLATHLGFAFYYVTTSTNIIPIPINNPASVQAIGLGMTWFLNIGDMIQRTIGTLIEYPAGSGAWGNTFVSSSVTGTAAGWANNGDPNCVKRALRVPVVFPPNINVEVGVEVGTSIVLWDNLGPAAASLLTQQFPGVDLATSTGTKVAIKATFSGYRMTVPVK